MSPSISTAELHSDSIGQDVKLQLSTTMKGRGGGGGMYWGNLDLWRSVSKILSILVLLK